MVDDLQRACVHRGCLSLYQLQRFLRLVPTRGLKSWVEKLMNKLDSLGLDEALTYGMFLPTRRS